MKRVLAALAMLALAGCASINLVDPAKPADVGDGVTLMPQVQWAWVKFPDASYWTQNGIGLDELHFYMGVPSGKPLFSIAGVKDADMGYYDSKMLPNDVQDLLVSSMQKGGYDNVQASHLAPCPFGTEKGFCFDLDFATKAGLEMKGRALAAERKDRLDLLLFLAPAEYYYGNVSPTVEQVFGSISLR